MGCDIHTYAEVRRDGVWQVVGEIFPSTDWEDTPRLTRHPFDVRHYGLFGFLANVRNYSCVPPIAEPRGLPEDCTEEVAADYLEWEGDAHSASWLSLRELYDHDYERVFEDRRYTARVGHNWYNGAAIAKPGEGTMTTLRAFLPASFFHDIYILAALGDADDVRVLFWFDD